MNTRHPGSDAIALAERVAGWLDDLSAHAEAAEAIGALDRSAAIAALRAYLQREPQVIPQPRAFAVAMLARLNTPETVEVLRGVLHDHPLHDLAPSLAESEYVVKNAAMEVLVARDYPARTQDIAFGIHERLPVAVRAAGNLHLSEMAGAIADLLDDDVLADVAARTLGSFGHHGARALLRRLDGWLSLSPYSFRMRLATIRGLMTLAGIGMSDGLHGADRIVDRALCDPHPLVRAAATLTTQAPFSGNFLDALVHGALGHDPTIAAACRSALACVGAELAGPATRALRDNAEPDLYGHRHPLAEEQRRWLVVRAIEAASESASAIRAVLTYDESALADAIAHGTFHDTKALRMLLDCADARIRVAIIAALARSARPEATIDLLMGLLDDADPDIRRQAFAAVRDAPDAALIQVAHPSVSLRPGHRGFCFRLRLRYRIARLRKAMCQ